MRIFLDCKCGNSAIIETPHKKGQMILQPNYLCTQCGRIPLCRIPEIGFNCQKEETISLPDEITYPAKGQKPLGMDQAPFGGPIDPDFQKKIEENKKTNGNDHNVQMSDGSVQKFSELTPEQTQGMRHGVLVPKDNENVVEFKLGVQALYGTFEWALAMMKAGKKVRRSFWQNKKYYTCVGKYKDCHDDHSIDRILNPEGDLYPMSVTDMFATDWELYEK